MVTRYLSILLLLTSNSIFAATIEVPFLWKLSMIGNPFAGAFINNTGGIGTSKSDTDTLAGNFIISTVHTPPPGATRIDPLPTMITLNVTSKWEGTLANSTVALDPFGLTIDTFIKSTAVISAPPGIPAFTPATEEIGSATSKAINQSKNFAFLTGPGTIPFSGSVDIQTLFGFGSGTLGDFATGAANLSVGASLVGATSIDITYQIIPIPSAAILFLSGLGSLFLIMQKKYSLKV